MSLDPLLYLKERGIFDITIDEMGAIPLLSKPDESVDAEFAKYLHETRWDKDGKARRVTRGLLLPYPNVNGNFGAFGRARVLELSSQYMQYLGKQQEEYPKFISPSSRNLRGKPGTHLYILPHDLNKMGKSKDVFCFVEGEVKAAAVSQHVRGLDDESTQYVVMGGGGVSMFRSAPEFKALNFKDRQVLIFFDVDALAKREVMQQEIQLAVHALAAGARDVKSVFWDPAEGKGIDDYLAKKPGPLLALEARIQAAIFPFTKYASPPVGDRAGYALDSLCREIAKVPGLKGFQISQIVADLQAGYKEKGLGKKEIRQELEKAIDKAERERKREDQAESGDAFKDRFHIPYTPWMPEAFEDAHGKLSFSEHPLCNMFVIGKYIATEGPGEGDTYLLNFQTKTLLVPSDVQCQYKKLAELFNQNREILHDGSAKLIQRYISEFWIHNQQHIPAVPYYRNTGWNKEGFFQLPAITKDINQAEFDFMMERKFTPRGDRASQYEFLEEILTKHRAGIFVLLALATPLLGPLGLPRYIVNIYGSPGSGKSTGCMLAMSLYGDPEALTHSMDSTKVGQELTFSLYKDLPVFLDEMNTAGANARKVAEVLKSTIYGFYQGKGRTRASIKVNLREMNEFMGLVMLTSERSIESVFSVDSGMNIGGAYRRTLEFPVLDPDELWDYEEGSEAQFFSRIYTSMKQHYGWLGSDWLVYIADEGVRARLVKAYDKECKDIADSGYNLRGTEKLFALLGALFGEIETFLRLEGGSIYKNLGRYCNAIIERQQRQIDNQIADMTERFCANLESFLAMNRTCFDGLCPDNAVMAKIYGQVRQMGGQEHIYLRPEAFKLLCNDYGFERDVLIPKLQQAEIFKPRVKKDENGQEYEVQSWQKKIQGVNGKVYHFILPVELEEEEEEEKPL